MLFLRWFGKNMLEPDSTICHICFACRITKATNTHSVFIIIIAFPWQQWLNECTSMFHYKDMSCPVFLFCVFRLVVNCSQYLTGFHFSCITLSVKKLRSYTSLRLLGDRQQGGNTFTPRPQITVYEHSWELLLGEGLAVDT